MYHHSLASVRQPSRKFNPGDEPFKDKNRYAFIAEITKAGDTVMPGGLPIIALFDTGCDMNWVSAELVDKLQQSTHPLTEYKSRTGYRRKNSKAIIISWSCGKLGQYSEESTFLIAPKAHFKMMFGCAPSSAPQPDFRPHSFGSYCKSRKSKSKDTLMQPPSETATDLLLRGIEDGTLLRLTKLPQDGKDSQMVVADLEIDLQYVHASYSFTDCILGSNSVADSSSLYDHKFAEQALSGLEVSSIQGSSETDTESHPRTESSNTSISENAACRLSSITHKLQRERFPWPIKSWANQGIEEGPWIPKQIRLQPRRSYPIRQCHNLSPEQESALAATKAAALEETSGYWIWDKEVKQYKHFDEGCTDPVWYNPPRPGVN
ncbi:hypothetical protein BKA61DRAFT_67093 [Leptodontidium sp. MPI-SDFR-AT-0119]|nr:hypothetical protein BKA61DRAFT_67093 [Leptodontidium sp. MPI-SDFR-AT-0119]